jgi:hypothetical protein
MTGFVFSLALIVFGPPGPVQVATFTDRAVQMELSYRLAREVSRANGQQDPVPELLAGGTLTVSSAGRRWSYDLGTIVAYRKHRITVPTGPRDGCRATVALGQAGTYAVFQSVLTEKGCLPVSTFIDVGTGAFATPLLPFDESASFAAAPNAALAPVLTHVRRIERVTLAQGAFVVVRCDDPAGREHLFSVDAEYRGANAIKRGDPVTFERVTPPGGGESSRAVRLDTSGALLVAIPGYS